MSFQPPVQISVQPSQFTARCPPPSAVSDSSHCSGLWCGPVCKLFIATYMITHYRMSYSVSSWSRGVIGDMVTCVELPQPDSHLKAKLKRVWKFGHERMELFLSQDSIMCLFDLCVITHSGLDQFLLYAGDLYVQFREILWHHKANVYKAWAHF